MRRIELIGCPGVGKSSLYREFIRQNNRDSSWLTPNKAYNKIVKEHLNNIEVKSKRDVILSSLLNADLFKKLHPYFLKKLLNSINLKSVWDYQQDYADLVSNALLGASLENKEPLRRLYGLNLFYQSLKDIAFIENSTLNDIVMFDESLSQKILGLTHWEEGFFENQTFDYFSLIPIPVAIINCKLDYNLNISRIKSRAKTIPGHIGRSNDELLEIIKVQNKIFEIGVDVLKKRGVIILTLDMSHDLNKNVSILQSLEI